MASSRFATPLTTKRLTTTNHPNPHAAKTVLHGPASSHSNALQLATMEQNSDAIPQSGAASDWPPGSVGAQHESKTTTTTSRSLRRATRASASDSVPSSSPHLQALTGQRLIIPCRNASSRGLSQPQAASAAAGGGDQPARSRGQTAPRSRQTQANLANFGGQLLTHGASGLALIVWHKDDQLNSPIFAVDARGASIREAKQQAIGDSLKGRARVELMGGAGAGAGAEQTNSGQIALVVEEALPGAFERTDGHTHGHVGRWCDIRTGIAVTREQGNAISCCCCCCYICESRARYCVMRGW